MDRGNNPSSVGIGKTFGSKSHPQKIFAACFVGFRPSLKTT